MAIITPKNIPRLIVILPIIGIIVTSILISSITIYTIKKNFQKEKQKITIEFMQNLQNTTKQRVELTYKIIDALYTSTNKNRKETILLMQQVLDKMRWGKNGYIFVLDFHGNTLYHPNKYYMFVNRWNFERHGIKVIQYVTKSALKHPQGTYVEYLGYNPDGSPKKKISFVKVYKPLKIIIGNGVYLNYLDKQLLKKQKDGERLLQDIVVKLVITALIISLVMVIIMFLFASILKKLFNQYDDEINQEKQNLFIKANFDTLTGVHNRNHFLLELKERLSLMRRGGDKLAILFVDLDHFKEINDSLGHEYGDKVLIEASKRLQQSVRESDVVARFGGDEFVILLNDIENVNQLTDVAQRVLYTLKQPIILNNTKYYISASIGISIYPDDAKEADILIKYADIAMYKAKKAGKDRFSFYTNVMSEEADKRIHLKNTLHLALEKEEFKLFFQPQIDKNNNLYGMEVLIRWFHPKDGIITPFHFIPLAIEIGLIDKIDYWVLEHSILQHKIWQKKGLNPPVISCNVTMYQLEKNDFVEELEKLLKKYSFDTKYINLEITEESIMKNPEKSIKMLYRIKKLGINVNIDDFGTGYSSLSYLKKFPVSALKIDRSFIKDIPEDKDDMVITKTILNLAKNLNLKVVAEGIETECQKDFVFENGCDYIQGYFYSKPIDAEEFEKKFLKEKKW